MVDITLISCENKEFHIDSKSIQRSRYLNDRINESPIKLHDINDSTLKLVIDYLNEYSNKEITPIPEVLSSNDLKQELSPFDYQFINELSFEQVFHLINAGVFLELDHLHDLSCARIAAFMKGKKPEEINKEFLIECQLTAKEAEELGLEVDDHPKA